MKLNFPHFNKKINKLIEKLNLSYISTKINKSVFSYTIYSVLVILFVVTIFSYFNSFNIKQNYPSDIYLDTYPSIWLSINGSTKDILKRKNISDNLVSEFNSLGYKATNKFDPEVSSYEPLLYQSLEELKDSKDILKNYFFGSKNIFLSNLIDNFGNSFSFINKNESSVGEEIDLNVSPDINNVSEYKYTSSEYPGYIHQGSESFGRFSLENTSDLIWEENDIYMIADSPTLNKSIFSLNEDEILYLAKLKNSPIEGGQIGEFEFQINSDLDPGIYDRLNFGLYKKEEDTFTRLNGPNLYMDITVLPEEDLFLNELKEYISQLEDIHGIYASSSTMDNNDFLLTEDDTFQKRRFIEFHDYEGYLLSENKNILLMNITSIRDTSNSKNINKFIKDIESQINKLDLPDSVNIDILGQPMHADIYNGFFTADRLMFLPLILSLLAILFCFIFTGTYRLGINLIAFNLLSFNTAFLIISTFTYISHIQFLSLSIILLFVLSWSIKTIYEISKTSFDSILDLSILKNDRKNKTIVYSTLILSTVLFSLILSLTNIPFVVFLLFFLGINFLIIDILLPFILEPDTRLKSIILNNKIHTHIVPTFIFELSRLGLRKSRSILIIFSVLAIITSVYSLKISYDNSDFIDRDTRKIEDSIRFIFGMDVLYPIEIIADSYESGIKIKKEINRSPIFIDYEDLYKYLPSDQEEKIGLITSIADNKNDLNLQTINDQDVENIKNINLKTSDFIDKLSTDKNSILYESKIIDLFDLKSKELIDILEKDNFLEVVNSTDNNDSDKKLDLIKNIKPVTKYNFGSFTEKYLKDGNYFIYAYPFGSVYLNNTKEKVKEFINTFGFDSNISKVINIINILSTKNFVYVFICLFLIYFFASILLKKKKFFDKGFIYAFLILILSQGVLNKLGFVINTNNYLIYFTLISIASTLSVLFITEHIRHKQIFDIQILSFTFLSLLFVVPFIKNTTINTSSFIPIMILVFVLVQFLILIIVDAIIESHYYASSQNKFAAVNSKIKSASYLNRHMERFFGKFISLEKYKDTFNISFQIGKLKNSLYEYLRRKHINKHNEDVDDQATNLYGKFLNYLKNKDNKNVVNEEENTDNNEESQTNESEISEPDSNIEDLNTSDSFDDSFEMDHKKRDERMLNQNKKSSKYDFGQARYIPVHIFETDDELTIEAEVGDVNIYDLDISINEGILCLKSNDSYSGTFFERYIGINVPIHEDTIDINLEDGELIIVCEKISDSDNSKTDSSNNVSNKETKDGNDLDNKKELLKSYMEENDSAEKDNSISKERHHISYKVHEVHDQEDHDVKIHISLNGLKIDHVKLAMKNNVINILEHDSYTGAPFHLDITLDNDLIHSSIKTSHIDDELIIIAKYRPEHIEVTDIKEEEDNS